MKIKPYLCSIISPLGGKKLRLATPFKGWLFFYMPLHFEVISNNPKSLMTLMTVTLMTGFWD